MKLFRLKNATTIGRNPESHFLNSQIALTYYFFRFTPVTNDLEKLFIYIHINADGQKEKCPTSPVLTLSLSLGAAILLLGALSILFFKCYIVITDRREYARHSIYIRTVRS